MEEMGERLRTAREGRGLSLDDVETATKIRKKYLVALEQEDEEALPPGVYARGLLRNYASFLGLDVAAFPGTQVNGDGALPLPRPPQFIDQPLSRTSRVNVEFLIGLALIAVVGALAWWMYHNYVAPLANQMPSRAISAGEGNSAGLADSPTAAAATPTASALVQTVLGPTPSAPAVVLVSPTPTSPPTPAPSPTPAAVALQVVITDRVWLRVTVDGNTVFERLVDRGATQTWTGQHVILRTGNAGGTLVSVNGQDQGSLGAPGQVVEREWIRQPDGAIATVQPYR